MLPLARFLLLVAPICFVLCCPAWSRTGVNDVAALDTRRFGSALVVAAVLATQLVCGELWGCFFSSASEWDVGSSTPGQGWSYHARARLRDEQEADLQVGCQPLAGGRDKARAIS